MYGGAADARASYERALVLAQTGAGTPISSKAASGSGIKNGLLSNSRNPDRLQAVDNRVLEPNQRNESL